MAFGLAQGRAHCRAAGQTGARGVVQPGAEAREILQLLELRQGHAQVARDRPERLALRLAAHARHRHAQIDRGKLIFAHQTRRQVDLPVRDGDQVGRNVGGQVFRLCLDHWQDGDRSAPCGIGELPCPFQQSRVNVKNIARKRLAPRRAAQQKRQLAIGARVVGQIIQHHKYVLGLCREMLGHCHGGVRRDIGKPRCILVPGRNDDALVHHATLADRTDHLGHRVAALTDGAVDADHAGCLLVQDGIHGQRRLAGLPVADDQFTLAQTHRHGSVDGLDSRRQRPFDRQTVEDLGRFGLHRAQGFGLDRALAVQRVSQRIHNPPQKRRTHLCADDSVGPCDAFAHGHPVAWPQQDNPQTPRFEVEDDASHAAGKLQQLVRQGAFQPGDDGNPVRHLGHLPDLAQAWRW